MSRPRFVLDEDDIMCEIHLQWGLYRLGLTIEEYILGQEMSEHLMAVAGRISSGESVKWETITQELNAIGERHGCEYGVPMPSGNNEDGLHKMVTARGTPLRNTVGYAQFRTELEGEAAEQGMAIRNSWEEFGDRTAMIVNTNEGPMAYWEYHSRVRKLMKSMGVRMDAYHLTVEAEMKAMESLKAKLNDSQYRCYVLNGMFPERSKRSNIRYMFRKGFPTVAISYHGNEKGRVLACLCMHPFGYYAGTWAGMMTPTDEVIAALLMMRGDEAKFWGKSGQWRAGDPRSGL